MTYVLELYSDDGVFQGYVKSISKANKKVEGTNNVYEARTFKSGDAVNKSVSDVIDITNGTLTVYVKSV